MRVSLAKISNDIVGLAVMALMSVAFIATQAQAGATPPAEPVVIDINVSFRSTGE